MLLSTGKVMWTANKNGADHIAQMLRYAWHNFVISRVKRKIFFIFIAVHLIKGGHLSFALSSGKLHLRLS